MASKLWGRRLNARRDTLGKLGDQKHARVVKAIRKSVGIAFAVGAAYILVMTPARLLVFPALALLAMAGLQKLFGESEVWEFLLKLIIPMLALIGYGFSFFALNPYSLLFIALSCAAGALFILPHPIPPITRLDPDSPFVTPLARPRRIGKIVEYGMFYPDLSPVTVRFRNGVLRTFAPGLVKRPSASDLPEILAFLGENPNPT